MQYASNGIHLASLSLTNRPKKDRELYDRFRHYDVEPTLQKNNCPSTENLQPFPTGQNDSQENEHVTGDPSTTKRIYHGDEIREFFRTRQLIKAPLDSGTNLVESVIVQCTTTAEVKQLSQQTELKNRNDENSEQ